MRRTIAALLILCCCLASAKDHSGEYKTGTLVSWALDSEVKHEHFITDYKVRRPVYKVTLGDSLYSLRPMTDIFPKDNDPLHYLVGKEFQYRLDDKNNSYVFVDVTHVDRKGKESHSEAKYFVMGVEPAPR
jgi:hypothetical protein